MMKKSVGGGDGIFFYLTFGDEGIEEVEEGW